MSGNFLIMQVDTSLQKPHSGREKHIGGPHVGCELQLHAAQRKKPADLITAGTSKYVCFLPHTSESPVFLCDVRKCEY
jgi:hypothetical protein